MFTYYKKALAFLCCTAAVTGLPARAAEKPAVEINLDVLNSLLLSTVQAPAAKPAYPKPAPGGADFLGGGAPAAGNYPVPNGVVKFAGGEPPVPPSPYYEQPAAPGLAAPGQQRAPSQGMQPTPWQAAPGSAPGASVQNAALAARMIPGQAPTGAQGQVIPQIPQGQVPPRPAPQAALASAQAPNLPKKGNIYTAENLETQSGSPWFNSVNGFRNAPPVVQRPGQQERYSFVTPEADANAGDLAAETLPWKNREAVRTGRPASLDAQRRAYNNVPSLSMKQTPFAGIPLGPTGPAAQGGMQGGLSAAPVAPGLGGRDPFAAARKSMAAGMRPGMIAPGGPLGGLQQKGRFAMQGQGKLQTAANAPAGGKRRAPTPEGVVPVPQIKPDPGARLALAQDIPADEGVPTFNPSEGGVKNERFTSGSEGGKKNNGFAKNAETPEPAKGGKKNKIAARDLDAEHETPAAKKDEKAKKNGPGDHADAPKKDAAVGKPEGMPETKKDTAKPDEGQQITSLRDRIRALRMKRETGKAAEAEEASNGIPGVPFEDNAAPHKEQAPSIPPLQEAMVPVPSNPAPTPANTAPSFVPPPAVPTPPAAPTHPQVPVTPPSPPPAPPEDPSLAALKGLAQADKAEKTNGDKKDSSAKGKTAKADDHAAKPAAPASAGGGSAVSFTPGADALSDAQKAQLDGFIKSVQGTTGKINIVGYASAAGEGAKSPEYISLKRVVAVRNYIMNKGLTHDRIMIKAKGDKVENPSQNDTVQLIVGN